MVIKETQISTHLTLCLAAANLNFKWVKITDIIWI